MALTQYKIDSNLVGANGQEGVVSQKALLDGTPFTAEWLAKMALDGNMYTINAGTGTAPITSAGAYVNTTPDLDVSCPAGVMCIPVFLNIAVEAYGTTALFEAVAAIGVGGVLTPTAFESITPVNNRLDLTGGSGLTAGSTGTGATYMTTNVIEFARFVHNKMVTIATADDDSSIGPAQYTWSALQTGCWPIMYSPSSITRLNVFMSCQATTGFITLVVVVPPLAAS